MGLADQLTLLRVAAVPLVFAVYISDFGGHDCGRPASSSPRWRRTGSTGGLP